MTAAKTGATSAGSMPAARSASASVILMAVTSSRVSTRRVQRSQTTAGTATRSSPAKSAAKRSAAGGLVQVVDLLEARLREFLHQRGHVDPVGDEADMAEPAAHLAQGGQVDVDDRVDARPLHLDHHVLEPGVGGVGGQEPGAVRLAEGCRGHGRLLDPGETLAQAATPSSASARARMAANGDRVAPRPAGLRAPW